MKYKEFFNTHPVFTLKELKLALDIKNMESLHSNLRYYINKGKIQNIIKGIYYVIPDGSKIGTFSPDSMLIISHLTEDAILAFHTALEFMGYSHSYFYKSYYYSSNRKKKISFKEKEYICIKTPEILEKKGIKRVGVEGKYYSGLKIYYTNRERTFVDCLDRPGYGGGIEEVYRCIEKYPYLDFEEIEKYLKSLGKKVLYAKVGFFLEQHKEKFFVEDKWLNTLLKNKPDSIIYFDSMRRKGKLIKKWGLIVPDNIVNKRWEEF